MLQLRWAVGRWVCLSLSRVRIFSPIQKVSYLRGRWLSTISGSPAVFPVSSVLCLLCPLMPAADTVSLAFSYLGSLKT